VSICERCDGTGFEIVITKDKDGKDIEIAQACVCRAIGGALSEEQTLRALRIPLRYAHCDFAHLDEVPEEKMATKAVTRVEAVRKSKAYVHRFGEIRNGEGATGGMGLLFSGTNGTGKTYLAVAVLRELHRHYGVQGQFWDFHELLREIRRAYDPKSNVTEYEVLSPIVDVEVLLLDDLGAWKMTEWMRDTLFYILNMRYIDRRPTLITTNYPENGQQDSELGQLELRDDANAKRKAEEHLIDRIGQRTRSRVLEMCGLIRLLGDDRRQMLNRGPIEAKLR
jgi:DNA replication protein DnaC